MNWPPYLLPVDLDFMSVDRLKALAAGRDIYIWGAAFMGLGAARALGRQGLEVKAFLDRSPRFRGLKVLDREVLEPEAFFRGRAAGAEGRPAFLILASGFWEEAMKARCLELGLREGRDFLLATELCPLAPSVDVAGVCNLRCFGCPRGNFDRHPEPGFMSAATYAQVLDKLLRELPFLGEIQLYTWGEPLLNRDIDRIVRLTAERGVASVLSTNLNIRRDLRGFLAAGPDLVRVSAAGWGRGYEFTHVGGQWDLFLAKFKELSALRDELSPGTHLELYYHLYRHNQGEDLDRMRDLAAEWGYAFRPTPAALFPRENPLFLRQGRPLNERVEKARSLLTIDVEEEIERSLAAAGGRPVPCLEVRYLPINWNLNVRVCGNYYLPTLADNFLATPLAEILRRKAECQTCRTCAQYGVHCFISNFMVDKSGQLPAPEERSL